jgi:hypothetical protein
LGIDAWLLVQRFHQAALAEYAVGGRVSAPNRKKLLAEHKRLQQSGMLERTSYEWDHQQQQKVLETEYKMQAGPDAAGAGRGLASNIVFSTSFEGQHSFEAAATPSAAALDSIHVPQSGFVEFTVRVTCQKQENEAEVSALACLLAMAVMQAQLNGVGLAPAEQE